MFLDIVFGLLGAVVFSKISGAPFVVSLTVIHIAFALLPDIDFIYQALRRKSLAKVESSHRHLLHNPLLYIPVGFFAVAFFSLPLAYSFLVMSLAHFLHDSIGLGWGVRWLYPFSKRSYKFFSNHDGSISWNPVTSWSAEEEKQLEVRTNPDKDWFRRIYLQFHPLSLAEHGFAALVLLIILFLLI